MTGKFTLRNLLTGQHLRGLPSEMKAKVTRRSNTAFSQAGALSTLLQVQFPLREGGREGGGREGGRVYFIASSTFHL